jgi:hypothetical protein
MSVLAGDQFDVKVSPEDVNGNVNQNLTANVTIAFENDPNGNSTLGVVLTVATNAAVADFNDLTVNNAGQGFTLQATSAGQDPANTDEFGVADLSADDIQWHRNSADFGGVGLAYTVEVAEALPGTTLAVYWSNSTSLDNRLSNPDKPGHPAYSAPAATAVGSHTLYVKALDLGLPPAGTADLLFVVDPKGVAVAADYFSNFRETSHVRMNVDATGELVVQAGGQVLRQRPPVAYQEVAGVRRE